MLTCAVACLLLHRTPESITRTDYGVPIIRASSLAEAWKAAGYAVAQDRMWQMELSRRLARGRMAEIFGASSVASDKEVLQTGYTDEELQSQLNHLPQALQDAFTGYAAGVNEFIQEGDLPKEFAANGFKPAPWTPIDSAAIGVRLLQYFGRGGAGAIRNMAVVGYLENRAPIKGRTLDVMDDFLWQNDPSSPTTVLPEDQPADHPNFPPPSREVTERHLAMLPKLGLFDLLPGLNLSMRKSSTLLAEKVGAPFRTGSYCMVVNGKRSASDMPVLLSGPQMGFTVPSIVHEMSIQAPGLAVVGMDIPGIPGVVIGHNRHLAWGLTSGVADTDDIVFYPKTADGYLVDGKDEKVLAIARTLHVKGAPDQTVVQNRTRDGVVVLNTGPKGSSSGFVFARHSSYAMQELVSMDAFSSLWTASTAQDADAAAAKGTMSFNVFFATDQGDIGYRYAGLVPIRSTEIDPRFPTPGGSRFAWKGMLPPSVMPHVINPKEGLLTNWNNKPAIWWPNLDTPVWGRIFRVDSIRRALNKPKLTSQDLELAAWTIARSDETWPFFDPYVRKAVDQLRQDAMAHPERNDATPGQSAFALMGFDGKLMDGSRQAPMYKAFLDELRKAIFQPSVGNFIAPEYFSLIAQPSVMLAALDRRTKFDYLQGRDRDRVVRDALVAAWKDVKAGPEGPARYKAPGIRIPGQDPIPYSNRGTYIQVVEMLPDGPSGRSVLPPGVAESGPHSLDQVPLSRAWLYKAMHRPWLP